MTSLTLTPKTIAVLRNFAEINEGQIFRPGNKLLTISPTKTIMAVATIPEEIPFAFALPSLNKMISILSLYDKVEISLKTEKKDGDSRQVLVLTGDGTYHQRFVPAHEKMIACHEAHDKTVNAQGVEQEPTIVRACTPNDPAIEFTLTKDVFGRAKDVAKILDCNIMHFHADGERLWIKTMNSRTKDSSDNFSAVLTDTTITGDWHFQIENMRFLPLDYEVTITNKGRMVLVNPLISYAVLKVNV